MLSILSLGARCPVTGMSGSSCGGARKLSETPATRPEHDALKAAFLSGTPIEAIAGPYEGSVSRATALPPSVALRGRV